MPKSNHNLGSWGECLAEKFLVKRGYEILERNFHSRGGEIDLVARRKNTLHFVEVKTRKLAHLDAFGLPQEAVHRAKQQRIIETALVYLAQSGDAEKKSWQFDVVSIVYSLPEGRAKIALIEDAFAGSESFD